MKNLNVKAVVYSIVFISAVFWFLIAYLSNLSLSKPEDFFGLIPRIVTLDLLVITLFAKWGWKWKMFRGWLVPFPSLSGTWKGAISSSWNPSQPDADPEPIPVIATIKQSLFSISCVMRTEEMVSRSYAESFVIEPEKQIKLFAYMYTSKPRSSVYHRSPPHDGAAILEILEEQCLRLRGSYWTERKTTGEIELEFQNKDL